MATRIVHLSDLHFPARKEGQTNALAKSVAAAKPDLIVVSGDLTRSGTTSEFRAAADFFRELPAPVLVVPGNHDIPVPGISERLLTPFHRFNSFFAGTPEFLETPDVLVVGFNSSVAMQFGFDWSLGKIIRSRLERCMDILGHRNADRLGVVACHHPLRPHAMDARRSQTAGGPEAFDRLAKAGMDVLLHGHLHRASLTCIEAEKRRVCEVCANTALSDRERGGPAGFNILDIANRLWALTPVRYIEGQYVAQANRQPDSARGASHD